MLPSILSWIIFIPLIFLLPVLFLPQARASWAKGLTIGATGVQTILAFWLYLDYRPAVGYQYTECIPWIQMSLGNWGELLIQYYVGVDGLNVALVLLAAVVLCVGAVASWSITRYVKAYFALYLLLSTAVVGSFVALDFFLFYLFFEFMLLPMYFLIGIWGGERREYAAIKFFLYTLLGSIFILVAMIGLYMSVKLPDSDIHTFSIPAMSELENFVANSLLAPNADGSTNPWRFWAFWALFIGFAIKLPAVPFHTWLPDAHVEAPTAISVVLAGILLKIGGYGLLRIVYPIFPEMSVNFAYAVALLGVVSIIYGAMNALAMSDLKKLVAYSSVSHMGFVLLGIASLTAEGINGAVYQMVSHGILSALLFLLVGVLYDRTHDRTIDNYRGLLGAMPYYGTFIIIAFFASLGLPGFSGFVGELFTLLGGFSSPVLPMWLSIAAALGIVLGAAYFLWTLQKMFLGSFWIRRHTIGDIPTLEDLQPREWAMLSVLAVSSLLLGILPHLLFNKIGPYAGGLLQGFLSFIQIG
ncbi:complex I subunit 4 family protein [Eisenibacter elegans]|uniref:complex I subunit 4 family protein n=1 Tax=Eisenibacter elegans TaxID=997 RepID=UPI0003F791B2|nr:NADH-quinone oxidoreductase subunit M [Eisenibacter elegans]